MTRKIGPLTMPAPLRRYALVAFLVALVTLLHYNTAMHLHNAHGIYRRLYYFPIILAAFRGGWQGGLITALACIAAYLPHAMGRVGHDPGTPLEKNLEMMLYVAVGLVCGVLVTRRERTLAELGRTLEEKSRMEAELMRQTRMAAVGRLSAGLAHEIRNPLASIKGAAEILSDDAPAADPKVRLLNILKVEAVRLNDVLTRFLDFARPADRHPRRFDAAAEAREVVELLRHRNDATAWSAPTPDAGPITMTGDREQVRQLLLNLALNAGAAAGEGGSVAVRVRAHGPTVELTVEDDGPGFSEESLQNLGTPFFTTKDEGTGLGLAICHRIVEDHGGTLSVESATPHGARVTARLPRGGEEA